MKSRNDVKFIIYQSLYIFVVCIVAIKGANLDMTPVDTVDTTLLKPKYAYMYIDTSANRVIDKKEFQQYIKFDSARMVILTREQYAVLAGRESVPPPPPVAVNTSSFTSRVENPETPPPPVNKEPDVGVQFPSNFIQYHANMIRNGNSVPLVVKTSSGSNTIPPYSTKSITFMGDNTVLLTAGNESKTYPVKENQKPRLTLQSLVPQSGDEISLRQIQTTTGYRVTINDDYADQLDYKITGPVVFKEVQRTSNQIVIDVRLNFLGSKASFDTYQDNHPNRDIYTATFNVTVRDKIAPQTVSQLGIFRFTDW
jgi:hypothetical protein